MTPRLWSLFDPRRLPGRLRRRIDRRTTRKVIVRGLAIRMRTSSPRERSRVESYSSKEPETLDWIDRLMRPRDVLYDVGANIGQYAIYASLRNGRGLRALCFEPESTNCASLNYNIVLNDLSESVTAYAVAIADETRFDLLRIQGGLIAGGALHQLSRVDSAAAFVHAQGVLSVSLDDLVYRFGLDCPSHIKIDVDGAESLIIRGASQLLADERLKSVLMELDGYQGDVRRAFADHSFTITREQASSLGAATTNVVFERS